MKHRRYRQGVLVVHARKRNPLKYDPSRTGALRNAFVKELRKRFAKLKLALRKLIQDEDALGLKESPQLLVGNQQSGIGRILEVPDVRQRDHFSCGAAAAMAVGLYFGVGPQTLPQWKRALGTDIEESTHPQAIARYFGELGLAVAVRHGMSLGDLAAAIRRGRPVIVPVQDYGPRVPEGARFDYGHYLVVIGVAMGYVFCQDPSEDNVVAGGDDKALSETGSIQKPGRIMIDAGDFLRLWKDRDADGNKYIRFGIVVGPPGAPPGDTAGTAHDLLGGVVPAHPDTVQLQALLDNPFTLSQEERRVAGPLTTNAFCPTGPGGGVDPTCSPGGGVGAKLPKTPKEAGKAMADALATIKPEVASDPGLHEKVAKNWARDLKGKVISSGSDFDALQAAVKDTASSPEFAAIADIHGPQAVVLLKGEGENRRAQSVGATALVYSHGSEPIEHINDVPKPGAATSEEHGGIGAGLRHEYGHRVYDRLSDTQRSDWTAKINHLYPDPKEIGPELTTYAGRSAQRSTSREECFTEAFAIGTSSVYDPARFSDRARSLIASTLAVSKQKLPTSNVAHECPLDPDECEDEQEVEGSATLTKGAGGKAHSLILDNTRWKFTTDADKLKRFAEWLKKEFGKDLTSPDTEELWRRYCEDGFRKGAGRAFDDTRKAQRALAAGDQAQMDFYAGNRDEFLRSAFGRPETVEKVQLLAARSFSELGGVTDAMEQRMTRVLADGLVQGKGPKEIARDLDDEVDIGRKRAEVIARTEIIRAHAEGQLDAMENLGVEEVGAAVEFTVTDDNVLCPECAALEGIVLKIEEAKGLIPVHPNCRCAWLPANVGEDDEDQKKSKPAIDAALADADIDDVAISRDRPQSILNQLRELLGNEGMLIPEQQEGAAATARVLRRRARKGQRIGVAPPPNDQEVIITEGQVGPESLEQHEKKAREDADAPPRN